MKITEYTKTPFTRWIKKLNERFGKPDTKELIVLFGYMSAGKTEFAYFVARQNIKLWVKVWFISLELDEDSMKLRIARKKASVSKIEFQDKLYTDTQEQLMQDTLNELEKQEWLYLDCPDAKDIRSIMKQIRELYDKWCRMFIIDNLDKIWGSSDENERYKTITNALQDFKNSCRVCIVLLHHAKKPTKTAEYMPAGMSWLRGSQKILDNATQVMEIWRDLDPDNEANRDEVYIYQYKDTFEWANGVSNIYFKKWDYYDERQERDF